VSIQAPNTVPSIKLLAILEASTVTGVAKNLLDFCRCVDELNEKLPGSLPIETSLVTFQRPHARAPRSEDAVVVVRSETNEQPVTDEQPNEFVKVAREQGLEVDVIAERFRFDLSVMPALRRIVERRAPDVVATHNLKSHFLMRLSGLHRRHPWVAFHHGYTTTDLKMRAYNQLNRWSLPAAHRVVTVCEAFAQVLAREGVSRERIIVQHNSISPEMTTSAADASEIRARLGIKEGERLLLAIGRLSREKAHVDLIAAFAEMRRAVPEINAKLLIVGDGPERGAIEEAARSSGLAERVHLTGHISDVTPYYRAADVFVLPSHSEGSPYVLLEAMTAGVAIVATAVGGVPEMVTHEETALLVAPRDPQAMAAGLARILMDAPLARRLTSNASIMVATRYSPERYVRSLFEIYSDLIPGKRASNLQTV
jgi:glycosyltransferase involved in cell wall biosynthesis